MTESPVTIAIPVYNRADRLPRTLASVASQTYRPLRVILVDNNSTDNSLQMMMEWAREVSAPDFHVDVLTEPAAGAASARNAALGMVKTPWVMFFDSDDTMSPRHLEHAVEAIRLHPDADIIGWDVMMHGIAPKPVRKPFDTSDPLYYGVQLGTMATQRYMCRTALMRDAGGWDPTMHGWDDIELGTRLLTCRPCVNIVKTDGEPTVDIHCHGDSITGIDFTHHLQDLCRACHAIYDHLPPQRRYIALLKLSILAGLVYRETCGHDSRAALIMRGAADAAVGVWQRMLLQAAYKYTRVGGRGAARLLHKLFEL